MPDRETEDNGVPDFGSMAGNVHPWVMVELSRLRRDTDKVALRQSFADAALMEAKTSMKADIDALRMELKSEIGGVRTTLNTLSSDIKAGVSKIFWLFMGGFVLAFVAFVVRGGLSV